MIPEHDRVIFTVEARQIRPATRRDVQHARELAV